MNIPIEPDNTTTIKVQRAALVAHLLDLSGHDVLAFGPSSHPDVLDLYALVRWHTADHEFGDGVGPKDVHSHSHAEKGDFL